MSSLKSVLYSYETGQRSCYICYRPSATFVSVTRTVRSRHSPIGPSSYYMPLCMACTRIYGMEFDDLPAAPPQASNDIDPLGGFDFDFPK